MTTHPMNPVRSEKGVALIIVLMLLAVMAGLTAGLSLNSQTEIAMAHNETYYAGARAAAEAGIIARSSRSSATPPMTFWPRRRSRTSTMAHST